MTASTATKWREVERKILAKLNIASEYQALGVELTSDRPNAGGWLSCWAIDRPHGNNPSAAINVGDGELRGRYIDRGGNGEGFGLWDFAAKYGNAGSWKEARKEFAKKAGLAKSLPKSGDDDTLEDRLEFVPTWQPLLFRGLLSAYRGITEEALRLCGGCIVKYPKKSPQPRYCVALPGYGPSLTDGAVRCYTIMACDGGQIGLYLGEGKPIEPRKRINVGPSGMLGRHGLLHLSQSPELVWKVEGVSDLLTLQSIIPEELRNKHLVVTNASGTHEVNLPSEVAHCFAGARVAVIHDADEPGQQGAKLWVGALAGVTVDVRNVQLPYPIEKAHGKDLRDWINEGHSYSDLISLHSASDPVTSMADHSPVVCPADSSQPERITAHQAVLAKVGIVVLGEFQSAGRVAVCYSPRLKKPVEIRQIDRYKVENLMQDFGEQVLDSVSVGEGTETKMDISVVRRAIAAEAGKTQLDPNDKDGVGSWLDELDRLFIVSNDHIVEVQEDGLHRHEIPRIGERLIDPGTRGDRWFDLATLQQYYAESSSPEWCQAVLQHAAGLFETFESLKHRSDTTLIVASVCASFLQTIWEFRPQIVVSGPTNCGKSYLLSKFVKPMLGKLCLSSDKTTEAGLRQAIGHSAKVVVMDEFERSGHRQAVLDFVRLAARGGTVSRGTNGSQKGIQFRLKHMLWMAGIENGLNDAADRNRVILIDMQKPPKKSTRPFIVPAASDLAIVGQKLLAVTLRHWRQARELAVSASAETRDRHDTRLIESYSTPLSIWAAAHGWNRSKLLEYVNSMLDERETSAQEESDESALLELILGSYTTVAGGEKRSVSDLLWKSTDIDKKRILAACGISEFSRKVEKTFGDFEYVPGLFFRQEPIKLTLLRDTKWKDSRIDQVLLRVNGATKDVRWVCGAAYRGVSIPVQSVREAAATPANDSDDQHERPD